MVAKEETETEEKTEEKPEEKQEKQKEEVKEEPQVEEPKIKVATPKIKLTKKLAEFFNTRLGRIALGLIAIIVALIFIFGIKSVPEPILFGLPPIRSIFLIATILSIFVSLVYKFMTDQTLMKELKKDLKKYQSQMKLHKKDLAKLSEVQKKAMEVNMKYMKQSFKPMIITLIPFFAVFTWLRGVFEDTIVIPLGFWEGHLGWVGTYIILSLVYTTIFRKLLRVV